MAEPIPPPRPRRRRLRRILWIAVLILVVLPVLIVLGVVLSLRAAGVRQAILARISALAAESGLEVKAEDFSPLWRRSGIELRNVRVGAPGAAPIATAGRVRAEIDLGSLRKRPLVVRFLEVEGARVDLNAPIPKIPETPEEAGAGPPVEIQRIVLRGGQIQGAPLAKPAADWVRGWNAREIDAQGSYRGGRLDLEVERGTAVLDRPGFGPQELQLAGRIGYEEKKPLRIDGLRVTGDGLRVAASGTVGLEEGAPTAVRFDLDAEPRALVANVPPRGHLRASGRIALPAIDGQVRVRAEEIPAEVLKPYLDPKLYADLNLAGTVADVNADAMVGPGDWNRITGTAEAVWRRGERRFVRAQAHLSPPIVATVEAEILPGSPGRRTVQGTVRAASWAEMAMATAEGVRAEVRLPDVRAAVAEVRSLWPRLVPAPPQGIPLQGSLVADVRLAGSLTAPDAVVNATWLPQTGSLVRVEAKGKALAWTGSAKVRTETLPLSMLSAFAPGLSGTVSGTVDVSGSPRAYRTRVEAATADLAYPPALQGLETGTVSADGTVVLRPLSYRGKLSVEGAGLVSSPSASGTARVERFTLAGDGRLQASPLRWDGALTLNAEGAGMEGLASAERVEAVADGSLTVEPLIYDGTLTLDGTGVEMPGTARIDRLRLASEGKIAADLQSLAARAKVDADRVVLTEAGTEIRNLHLEADANGPVVRLSSLSGELPEGRTFNATGRVVTEPLLAEADLDLRLVNPVDAVSAADLTARLRNGVVEVDAPRLETASGPGSLKARVPLGTLAQMPQLAEALASLPGEKARGPVSLSLAFPQVDSQPLLAALGLEPRPERVRAGITADLSLDPTAPAAGTGEVRLTGLTLETPDARVTAEGPAVLRLGEGRLVLDPVHLRIDGGAVQGAGVDLQASADLARSWQPLKDPVASAVTGVSARGSGTLDAAILNPYLQGGAAEGSLVFEATASGPPDRLAAQVEASGAGATFVWPTAGAQIQDPRVALDLRDGLWTIREGRMAVNGGTVDLAGGFSTEGGLNVEATLAKVRYRLDYGIDTLLSGNLHLKAPPEGRSLLSGGVTVERGVLDRNVNLDREVFTLLFKPPDTPSTEESALAAVDVDLNVRTRDGVRVRNNIGDLRVSWENLQITGTLENPVIRGRIDVDPRGILYAYGQRVRIDRGSFLFTGDPLTDPKIDLATTSSLQDPTIAELEGGSLLDLLPQRDKDDEYGPYTDEGAGEEEARKARGRSQELLGAGLTGYYGARVVERLGQSIGLGGFSVLPPELSNALGEDPSARLTVGRDLSRNVSLALSIDLRNAERQTYLFSVQNIRSLPGLRVDGLTNDEGNEAASLQQVLSLGGGGGAVRPEETGPRLRRINISTPKGGVSKRQIRRAIRLEKKRPVPEGVEFVAELDVAELLRRRGYPDPRITVKSSTPRPGWVDLAVTMEPGPRVTFVFEGDSPPRALRPEITELYRTNFYEPISIEEMKRETVRAFRSTGHVDPKVAIEVRREVSAGVDDPDGPRMVTLRSEAGRRRSLEELRIAGLSAEEERLVVSAFPGTLSRAELAAGGENADRRLLLQLRALGYPDAQIATRFVKGDGSRLVMGVEPGPRQTLARIEVRGVEDGERQRLLGLVPLRPGDPARLDRIVQGSREIEADLLDRGFADAVVRSETTLSGLPEETSVVYDVTPGPQYRLAGVDIAGERASKPAPLLREADLEVGEPFRQEDVEDARSRLFRTGVFTRVDAEVEKDGTPGEGDADARVTFSIAERPRFRFGYGVRWESEEGTGAVVDFVDQNFLGRAMTFGLRGLYQEDDRSGRLYLQTGGILGTGISLETYAEGRRQIFEVDNLIEDRREAALQASRPIGRSDTARLYARYRTTRVFEIEPNIFVPLDLETRLPYLGVQLLRDTRDDPIDPSRGLFASLDLSGSDTFLGSDFQFLRLFAQASTLQNLALAGRRFTWAQSVRLGLAEPFGGQELIRSERFFAGGPYSVRGYEMESLGPREILGDIIDRPLGGEALFILNEEIRVPLPWDLTGLLFFDAGQVWAQPEDADFDLAKSLGLGLRARTPLGLIRLDAAYPLDARPGEKRYRVYVGFGNAF